MATLKQLSSLIDEGVSLKLITQSLGEISAIRLNKIRRGVERNRLFFAEIASLYQTVRQIAAQKRIVTSPKNNKNMIVVLTSNQHFSSKLNAEIFNFYKKNSPHITADHIIVGRSGSEYLKKQALSGFESLIFKDDLPSYDELKSLSQKIYQYSNIYIYYTQSKTMLEQIPTARNISTDIRNIKVPAKELSFIFEPEIDKVLNFFDTQINILLLEQTFFEAELARVASRLLSMSEAEKSADKFLSDQRRLYGNAKKSIENIKLLDSLNGQFNLHQGGKNG